MAAPLIQVPPSATPPKEGPRIFVMSERYRQGASGAVMVEPKKEAPKAPSVPPKPVPPPPPPKAAMKKPTHGKPHGKVAVLISIVVLLVLGVLGFVYYRFVQTPAPEPTPIPPVVTEPTPTPPPPVVTEPTPTPPPPVTSPFPEGVRPGTDTDSDGLSDVEELVIYRTDPGLPDSDSDGFLDGNEVFNLYNPAALAPGTLLEAGFVASYQPPAVTPGTPALYGILYPNIWTVTVAPEGQSNAVFAMTTGESVILSVQDKTVPTQTLAEWYAGQALPPGARPFTTKGGLSGLASEDQLTVWVDARGSVITLHYDTGIKGAIDYLQTFKMMQNSLHLN